MDRARHTHDYKRHGTTSLFAALDTATGSVIGKCYKQHRHQEFINFLNLINRNVSKNKDVHLITDNYATHKHEKVKKWFKRHKRFHIHFTPTSASWMNQVETWFGNKLDRALEVQVEAPRGRHPVARDLGGALFCGILEAIHLGGRLGGAESKATWDISLFFRAAYILF